MACSTLSVLNVLYFLLHTCTAVCIPIDWCIFQQVSDTAIKLEEHKEEIDRFVKDIMEATRHSQRLVYLRMLQQQLTKFLQDYEVPPISFHNVRSFHHSQISLEILEKRRIDWPIHQVMHVLSCRVLTNCCVG